MRLLIIITAALICTAQIAFAEEPAKTNESEKVIIYYFQDTSKTDHYRYYSYVIADSIANDLKKTELYTVQTFPVAFGYILKGAPDTVVQMNKRMLADRGKKFNANYIITGSYFVRENRISISTQIFNVKEEKLLEIQETSTEIGALLFTIIEKITEQINSELDGGYHERKELIADSPYSPLYTTVKGAAFGITYGSVTFHGDWGKLYDNTEMISLFLNYDLANITFFREGYLRNTAASLIFDYFNNDSTRHRSNYSVWGMTANLFYQYPLTNQFFLSIGAGLGGAKSELIVRNFDNGPDDMFNAPESRDISYDPYLNVQIGTRMIFAPLEINTGISYRRIFYSDTDMIFSVIFFGFGYQI